MIQFKTNKKIVFFNEQFVKILLIIFVNKAKTLGTKMFHHFGHMT